MMLVLVLVVVLVLVLVLVLVQGPYRWWVVFILMQIIICTFKTSNALASSLQSEKC